MSEIDKSCFRALKLPRVIKQVVGVITNYEIGLYYSSATIAQATISRLSGFVTGDFWN